MPREKYRVIKEHKATFPYAMIAREGDIVKVGKEDNEMPGWYWCKDSKNVEAWVPKTHIDIEDGRGIFNQDYNSIEHNVQPGEIVQYLDESLGWVECLNDEWKYGWLPINKLEKI